MPRRKAEIKSTKRGRKPKVTVEKAVVQPVDQFSQKLTLPKITIPTNVNNYLTRRNIALALGTLILLALAYMLYRYLIVAWVDGRPITRLTLDQRLEERYGSDMKDQIIAETLVQSEAGKRGVTVTQEELDTEYQKFEQQFGGAESVTAALQAQGLDQQSFKSQLKLQVLIKKMFGDKVASDAAVEQYIAENQDQFKDSTDEAKLKAEVREQLTQQDISQGFRTWLQEALQSSRVKRS